MKRRVFTLLSGLSLVLCAGACVLWVRSYWVADEWMGRSGSWSSGTGSTRGVLFRYSIGPTLKGPGPASALSGYFRSPPFSMRGGRPFPGDPGIRQQIGGLGFMWFVSDGGTSATPPPPSPSLPGVSFGWSLLPRDVNTLSPTGPWRCFLLFSLLHGCRIVVAIGGGNFKAACIASTAATIFAPRPIAARNAGHCPPRQMENKERRPSGGVHETGPSGSA